ncbi:MAG: hypothetical protein JXB47_05450 [Anaerolineae bacterium]|nr:hypothetical protein [Anaerolineae bacterium]
MSLEENRRIVREILNESDPADAPTAHYALYHPPERTVLDVSRDHQSKRTGFVARCQTGLDLFRPLVTMRCYSPRMAEYLTARVLAKGRHYIFFARRDQLTLARHIMQFHQERILHIYQLDPARFRPVINVLVQQNNAPDGSPRFEVHSGGLQAVAGVNWQSNRFAELFVHTEEEAQRRGWGRSVLAACTEQILKAKQMPLYLVEPDNVASLELARNVGYVDTGARQVYAEVMYMGADE